MLLSLGIAFRDNPHEKSSRSIWSRQSGVRAVLKRSQSALDIRRDACSDSRFKITVIANGRLAKAAAGRQDRPGDRSRARGDPQPITSGTSRTARKAAWRGMRWRRLCFAAMTRTREPPPKCKHLQQARLALHRLPAAGHDRHEPDGGRHVGRRLRGRRYAGPQAAQAVPGHADAPQRFPARPDVQPAVVHAGRRRDPAGCSATSSSASAARGTIWS